MSTPSPATTTPAPKTFQAALAERLQPWTAPYYITVAAVLGAITAGFVVVFALMILVVTNFNVLGWME